MPKIETDATTFALSACPSEQKGLTPRALWRVCCATTSLRPAHHPTMRWKGCTAYHLNRDPLELPREPSFSICSTLETDEILHASRNVGDLCYQNAKLMIFPDYSVETQKLRKSFDHVKVALRERNIRYSVLFPARLRAQDGETTRFFNIPQRSIYLVGLAAAGPLIGRMVRTT